MSGTSATQQPLAAAEAPTQAPSGCSNSQTCIGTCRHIGHATAARSGRGANQGAIRARQQPNVHRHVSGASAGHLRCCHGAAVRLVPTQSGSTLPWADGRRACSPPEKPCAAATGVALARPSRVRTAPWMAQPAHQLKSELQHAAAQQGCWQSCFLTPWPSGEPQGSPRAKCSGAKEDESFARTALACDGAEL